MEFNEIRKEANKKVLEIMQLINTGIDFEYFFDLDSVQYRVKSSESIINKMKKWKMIYIMYMILLE